MWWCTDVSVCVLHPNSGSLIWPSALIQQNASGVYMSGPGLWEVSPASSGMCCGSWQLGQRMFCVAMCGSVVIELSHGLSSSGYMYDSVLPGQAVVECDNSIVAWVCLRVCMEGAECEWMELDGVSVGGKMVQCMSHLWRSILAVRIYHHHHKSGIPS